MESSENSFEKRIAGEPVSPSNSVSRNTNDPSQGLKLEDCIRSAIAPGQNVLITAALPYANGNLHVGHVAGAYLPSNIYSRYLRSQRVSVRTVCGSDDFGAAMVLSANKEKMEPAELATMYREKQKAALKSVGIEFDIYSGTSINPYHTPLAQEFFRTINSLGCFEKIATLQFYDESREMFLPDRFVRGTCAHCNAADQNGDQCEQCGRILDADTLKSPRSVLSDQPATVRSTTHWFLDLRKFEPKVREWLETATVRDNTRTYVTSILEQGLVQRSMTRDIQWGIPVPIDDPDAKGKVLYVWFDAPIGYISNTEQLCAQMDGDGETYRKWWSGQRSEIYHFIGEDNTIFHCVIWIAMLSAEGSYNLPKGVIVNQYLNLGLDSGDQTKMSKSRGTAVMIEDYVNQGGQADSLRYYLTMVAPEKNRSLYNHNDLITRHNSELGAAIGNLFQRVIAFTVKNFGRVVPNVAPAKVKQAHIDLKTEIERAHVDVTQLMNKFEFRDGLGRILEFSRYCNKWLELTGPWKELKVDREGAETTLAHAFCALRFLTITLSPFLPESSAKAASMLKLSGEDLEWQKASQGLPSGHEIGEAEILFPRIETASSKQPAS